RRAHARGHARGDHAHHPRPSHALRGGVRGDARRPRSRHPHLAAWTSRSSRMDFELTAEQQALRARARELADATFAERAARWDASEEYPWDNVKDLVAARFMGMTVPREHGGPDRTLLDVVLVIEEIARACGVTARIVVEGSL